MSKTNFRFFDEICLEVFGEEQGKGIIERTNQHYEKLMAEMDDRGNQSIRLHMSTNMLPTIAYYKTLLQEGYTKEKAYDYTLKMTQKAAEAFREKNRALVKFRFGYNLFKLFCKMIIQKSYPKEGWEVEWVKFDGQEIHMNFNGCVYYDTVCRYDCPELCTVFCKNDPTVFSGYEPAILFKREGTIAEGKTFCDFHFYNARKK